VLRRLLKKTQKMNERILHLCIRRNNSSSTIIIVQLKSYKHYFTSTIKILLGTKPTAGNE
jgi:hypothetical protein